MDKIECYSLKYFNEYVTHFETYYWQSSISENKQKFYLDKSFDRLPRKFGTQLKKEFIIERENSNPTPIDNLGARIEFTKMKLREWCQQIKLLKKLKNHDVCLWYRINDDILDLECRKLNPKRRRDKKAKFYNK